MRGYLPVSERCGNDAGKAEEAVKHDFDGHIGIKEALEMLYHLIEKNQNLSFFKLYER